MLCSFQIKPWDVKCMENIVSSISMIGKYWTQHQSETMALIGWFQSGDQNSSGVGNKLVIYTHSEQSKCSIYILITVE